MVTHPSFAFRFGEVVQRLIFPLEIPGQFLGVEAIQGAQPFVKRLGVAVAAQVLPGNETGQQKPVDRPGRRGDREVERRHAPLLAASNGPDRLHPDIAGIVESRKTLAILFGHPQKVENPMLARPTPGHQRDPSGRGQGIGRGAQHRPCPARHEGAEKRHDDLAVGVGLDQCVQHGEGGAIQADEQGPGHTSSPRCNFRSTKTTSSPMVRSLTY